MKLKSVLVVLGLLLLAVPAPGQDKRTADPVTGNWGSDSLPFMELKLEKGRVIRGTTIFREGNTPGVRAAIKEGTFEPKTRTFKLQGQVKHPNKEGEVPYVIEGKIDGDTMSGTYDVDGEKGNFTFKKMPPQKRDGMAP